MHWVGSAKKDLLALPAEVIDIDLIHERLKLAQQHYKDHHES